MSNEFRAGLRIVFVALIFCVVAAAFGWIGVVDARQRDDAEKAAKTSERIGKLEVVVPRIDAALIEIAKQQGEIRRDVSAEIQALRREIQDAGPHWGRALRPARGGGQ